MAANAAAAEAQMPLPPRMRNARDLPELPNPPAILLNGYKMDLKEVVPEVHLFHLEFFATWPPTPQGQPQRAQAQAPPLNDGDKNDVDVQIRRRLHWLLFDLCFRSHPTIFPPQHRHGFAYDCSKLLFCVNDLGLRKDEQRTFQIGQQFLNSLPPQIRSYPPIRNATGIKAIIQRTPTSLNLRSRSAAMADGGILLTQFLEILTSQYIQQQDQHLIFGSEMFSRQNQFVLRDTPQYVLKDGLQKNVRIIWSEEKPICPILQIRPKKSAFYAEMPVVEFIGRHFGLNQNQLANQFDQHLQQIHERASKQIKGLMVITTHMEHNLIFKANELTQHAADRIQFLHEGRQVTVAQYMQQRYNRQVNPMLPCVIRRFRGQDSHYPMEVLKIVPGQRVKLEKQTIELVQEMIRQCQILPANMPREIAQQSAHMALNIAANPFLRSFGVRIDAQLIRTANAHRLLPPAIQYDPPTATIEPNNQGALDWRTRGARFIYPTQLFPAKNEYAVVAFNLSNSDRRLIEDFVGRLVQEAQNKGIQSAQRPTLPIQQWNNPTGGRPLLEYVKEKQVALYDQGILFMLLIAPGKMTAHKGDIHHCIKLMETHNSMLTQHIAPETVRKFLDRQRGGTTVENVLMKMNMKMDGANYDLVADRRTLRPFRNHDIVKDEWLRAGRMFVGLEFSHAPPNAPRNMSNRKGKKVSAIPTVVGMAWTIGDDYVLRMRGTYWMQTPRLAIANDENCRPLIENFKKALVQYHEINGRYPEQIIVFRGGASEGEFKKVAYWEGRQSFERAINELRNPPANSDIPRLQGESPRILIIVCQAKNNYRIVPVDANARDRASQQNVQPGTVLEEYTSPNLTEFLLVAQKALQGTAQPLRCTLVYPADKQIVPLLELQYLCYHLCYSHGICTGSIAVPGPLKAAAELAKRGKNNWDTRPDFHRQFDYPDIDDEVEAQSLFDDQMDDVFEQQSTRTEPNIPTKFWA